MRRHNVRQQYKHPDRYYVTPALLTGVRDAWGQTVPGQWDESELPEALFAPGVSSEDGMLSEAVEHRAQLLFHERVPVGSTRRVRIPGQGDWMVVGHPGHWPKGTVLTLERAS